jgi:hypothetical protein
LTSLLRSQEPITFFELQRFIKCAGQLIHSIYALIESPSNDFKAAYSQYFILSLIIQAILDQQFEE